MHGPEVGHWPTSGQGLQILLISGVTVTSASQILESFWNIWSQVSQRKKPFSDFPACGPGVYYVVVQFYPWFNFYFPLFLGVVMYDNEFETKENKI